MTNIVWFTGWEVPSGLVPVFRSTPRSWQNCSAGSGTSFGHWWLQRGSPSAVPVISTVVALRKKLYIDRTKLKQTRSSIIELTSSFSKLLTGLPVNYSTCFPWFIAMPWVSWCMAWRDMRRVRSLKVLKFKLICFSFVFRFAKKIKFSVRSCSNAYSDLQKYWQVSKRRQSVSSLGSLRMH